VTVADLAIQALTCRRLCLDFPNEACNQRMLASNGLLHAAVLEAVQRAT